MVLTSKAGGIILLLVVSLGGVVMLSLAEAVCGVEDLPGSGDGADEPLDGMEHLDARLIDDGIEQIACGRRGPRGKLRVFARDLYRGRAQSLYMHKCKKLKRSEQKLTVAEEDLDTVAGAFNRGKLRLGDQVRPGNPSTRLQTYDLDTVLLTAWRSLGKCGTARLGVEGGHRGHEMVTTVSSSLSHCQDECTLLSRQECEVSAAIPAFLREFDCTPCHVVFGTRLQEQLHRHARYPVLGDDGQWRCVRLDEFRTITGISKVLSRGVLDLFVCNHDMCWMGEDDIMHGSRHFGRPMFLQHGNSSCMHSAIEKMAPSYSMQGIKEMCEHVPFAFALKSPDAHSGNVRLAAKQSQELPENCGEFNAKCSIHQGHRIIEGAEKQSCGDIYSCCCACSHTGQQGKLQASFREATQNLQLIVGDPPARFFEHNKTVLMHTVLRREAFQSGSILPSDSFDISQHPIAIAILQNCNGDWTTDVPQVYTAGRDITKEEARELFISSLLAADVLLGNDSNLPSMDDWFSLSEHAAKVVLGLMCHSILKTVVDLALPTWHSMAPPVRRREGRSMEGAERYRVRMQKKCWRMKCFLASQTKKENVVLLVWLGVTVEHLMFRVDYMDERHKGAWDLPFADLNPFTAAREHLTRLVAQGKRPGSALVPVFAHFSDGTQEDDARLLDRVRTMGCDFGSQVWWRYLPLHELPFTLVDTVNPGLPAKVQVARMKESFQKPPCCVGVCMNKVRKVYGSWKVAYKDVRLRRGLKSVAYLLRLGNFRAERVLALIRKAFPGPMKHESVEAICSKGFLQMMLFEHLKLGRDDPRYVTRQQLLEDGVPLRCQPRQVQNPQCGNFVMWRNQQDLKRKQEIGKMSKAAHRAWLVALKTRWDGMSEEAKAVYLAEVRTANVARLAADTENDCRPNYSHDTAFETVISSTGSQRQPFTREYFELTAKQMLDCPPDSVVTFSKLESALRTTQADKLFQEDVGSIGPAETFHIDLPCCLAHPGICAAKDAGILATMHSSTKVLRRLLQSKPRGSIHRLWLADGTGQVLQSAYFLLSHFRGANPKLALLVVGSFCCDLHLLKLPIDTSGEFSWTMDISVVGNLWRAAVDLNCRMYFAELKRDLSVHFPCGDIIAVDKHAHNSFFGQCQVYPEVKTREKPNEERQLIDSGIERLRGKRRTHLKERLGVKMRIPGKSEESSCEGSSQDCDSSDLSSFEGSSEEELYREHKHEKKRPCKTATDTGGASVSGGSGAGGEHIVAYATFSTGGASGSGDGAGGAAPKRKVKRAECVAPPKSNQEVIDGRIFTRLNVKNEYSGLSLKCQVCLVSKNLNYVKSKMPKSEAVRRLLAWETVCGPDHIRMGGILLSDFA